MVEKKRYICIHYSIQEARLLVDKILEECIHTSTTNDELLSFLITHISLRTGVSVLIHYASVLLNTTSTKIQEILTVFYERYEYYFEYPCGIGPDAGIEVKIVNDEAKVIFSF